jgi:tetratricopeptide (TPR) repeat protein
MRRVSATSAVLWGLALACALGWAGRLSGEPLSVEAVQQPAAAQEKIPELVDALTKLNKGDVEGALADMKAAATKHPELPPAEIIMAQVYSRANRPDAIRYWLERAVVESPADPEAPAMLAQEALQNKRIAEARLLFEKAHQLLANFGGDAKRKQNLQGLVLRQLAVMAMGRKEWDNAKGYLDELLKLRPSDADALQLLARVSFEQGKIEEALEKLKAAKVADDKMLVPQATLAQWFEGAGKRKEAQDYMVQAINAAPNDFTTRLVAANWALQAQAYGESRKQADIAIKFAQGQPIDPTPALIVGGSAAIFQGDYPAAEDYLRKAVAAAPANFAATNNLALALCEQDDKAKQRLAGQYADLNARLYANDPDNVLEALSTLGRVLFRLGELTKSDQVFRKIVAAGRPLSPDTAFYIAALYAATDRKDDAKKLLAEVVKKEGLVSQRKNAEQLLKDLGP